MRKLLPLLALFFALPALATTYYVRTDGGSTTQCTGTTNAAYPGSGTGQACAFSAIQGCIDKPVVAGDTCEVQAGTYRTTGGSGRTLNAGIDFCGLNGSAGNPITFKAATGASVTLCVNNGGVCTNAGTAIGTHRDCASGSYVTVQGFTVIGEMFFQGMTHITITGNDISGSNAEFDSDQNCDTLRIERCANYQIDHNRIHDPIIPGTANCGPDSPNPYKNFVCHDVVFEYNTIERGSGTNIVMAIAEKDGTYNNTIRFNDVKNGNFWGAFQNNSGSSLTGNRIYGNIFRDGYFNAISYEQGTQVYNNTFAHGGLTWAGDPGTKPAWSTSQVWNNIITNPFQWSTISCENASGCNVAITNLGTPSAWSNHSSFLWDYNVYDSDGIYSSSLYSGGSDQADIAAWRASSGLDAHSIEGNTGTGGGPCTFTNTAAGDYHIVAATLCKTGGCTNWPTCSTTTTEYGAYGVATCVGYQCGAATQTCGNNVVEGTEVCDGTSVNGETCASRGFLSGILGCNAGCTAYDTTACLAGSKRSGGSSGTGSIH